DKLSYEIFSILESKFLFGYDDHKLWIPTAPPPAATVTDAPPAQTAEASSFKNQRGKVCVLCLDGGGGCGMRGILPGKALAYLEQALKTKSGDHDARISDYFDVAAGAGVGGVFAAMLFATRDGARPLFHADDTWRFLADQGKRLFRKGSPSSSSSSTPGMFLRCLFPGGEGSTTAAIERAMKEAFGESLTLRDTVKPVLIPCYDLRSSAPFVFSRADALESESFDFRLWEVCRATWAEPGRFEPAEISSVDGATACVGVDGGLAMSNPAAAAITHVLHNKQEFPFVRGVEDLMVLSLGCGEAGGAAAAPLVSEAENRKFRRWGPKEWARPISRIAADGSADLVDQAVALAFGQCRSSNYVRVQVQALVLFSSSPVLGLKGRFYLGLCVGGGGITHDGEQQPLLLSLVGAHKDKAGTLPPLFFLASSGCFPISQTVRSHRGPLFSTSSSHWFSVSSCIISSFNSHLAFRQTPCFQLNNLAHQYPKGPLHEPKSPMGRCSAEVDYDARPVTVKVLSETAEEMLRQKNVESVLFGGKRVRGQTNMEKLDWLAGELVLEHRRRSCRIAPTVALKRA
ncbi:unnamed protein product, partial [Musa hybrid cultivar]